VRKTQNPWKRIGEDELMRKVMLALALAGILALTFNLVEGQAQMGPGMMGPGGYGPWQCPYCGHPMWQGGYGMGPGMMGPGMMGPGMMGGMMGPGMMGRGMCPMMMGGQMGPGMMGPGMMGRGMMCPPMMGGPGWQQYQKPLEEKDATGIVENYLASTRNPNLKLGVVKDLGHAFEVEILTKENSLVDKVIVDKGTGWMRSIY